MDYRLRQMCKHQTPAVISRVKECIGTGGDSCLDVHTNLMRIAMGGCLKSKRNDKS